MTKIILCAFIIAPLLFFRATPASSADPEIWPKDRFEFLMDYASLSVEAELCKTKWQRDIHQDWLLVAAHSRTALGMTLREIANGMEAGKELTLKFYRDHPELLDCKRTQEQMIQYEEFLKNAE